MLKKTTKTIIMITLNHKTLFFILIAILVTQTSLAKSKELEFRAMCSAFSEEQEIKKDTILEAQTFNKQYKNSDSRKLVLFFDGTGNDKSSQTNIWKLYQQSYTHACQGEAVIPYYMTGVGTNWYDKIRGGAFGSGIDKNIKTGYQFLVEHYQQGDEIYLFGFSRGAYTARSLNGLIEFANLIDINKINPKKAKKEIKAIFKMYNSNNDGKPNFKDNLRNKLSSTFSHKMYDEKITVTAIGVFDTVPALGFGRDDFPDNHRTNLFAKFGFHALSLDEQRNDFRLLRFDEFPLDQGQQLSEVWFAGAHADVGGGYNQTDGLESLARNWMIENFKAFNIFPSWQEPIDCTKKATCELGELHDEFLSQSLFSKMGISRRLPDENDVIHGSVICRIQADKLPKPNPQRESPSQTYDSYNLREDIEGNYQIVPYECVEEI